MNRALPLSLVLLSLSGCAGGMPGPSLTPRAAEAIDPRLPVGSTEPHAGLLTAAAEIAALQGRLDEGARAFDRQLGATRSRVSAAGARASESWVQAQESLSLLERSHEGVSTALADLDALVTDRIERDGWASPLDRDAAEALLVSARALSERQRGEIASLAARLAR